MASNNPLSGGSCPGRMKPTLAVSFSSRFLFLFFFLCQHMVWPDAIFPFQKLVSVGLEASRRTWHPAEVRRLVDTLSRMSVYGVKYAGA